MLKNFIGLGTPLIYQHSKIFGYDLMPNKKLKERVILLQLMMKA